MGTSGSFSGGKPMVPSWVGEPPTAPEAPVPEQADDQNDQSESPDEPKTKPPETYPPIKPPAAGRNYGPARSDLTSGFKNLSGSTIGRGAGKFVAASGGGRVAARQMNSSRALAGGILGFADSVINNGPNETLARFDLEHLAGAPAEDVFLALTDTLCPPGGTIDEAIARDALLETIAELAANGIGNFDELTSDELQLIFMGVVERSIVGRILNEIGTNTLKIADDTNSIIQAQKMLTTFVSGCVRDQFNATGESISSLDSNQLEEFVLDLYSATFEMMQTLGEAQ